ncbi:BTB/POZ and MATH domain-containing protein 2 [Rhynchospora pubera]|uniref:BTB/POZ and MATH domain-containing protein 2 n=1 Tax=Rhynchospora pubera TaxID=906938 RepID=A0AAV8CZX8_9POAL|nr:BTB/POZ and MATH domain-containing protein 2 [Rhynchospora pubera]
MDFIDKSDLEAEFVKDDYITLFFSVTIQSNNSLKEVPKQLVNGIVPFTINEQFAELLENKEMADITFEVGGEIFTAHKSILSVRSPVFKAEFLRGMAESNIKSIQIKEIKPVIFKALLHFIYTDSVPDMADEDTTLVTQVQHLFKAADRYRLEGLKVICEEVLIRNITMDTLISSLALAEEHNCQELKNACLGSASEPEILLQLARKTEYVQLMQQYPESSSAPARNCPAQPTNRPIWYERFCWKVLKIVHSAKCSTRSSRMVGRTDAFFIQGKVQAAPKLEIRVWHVQGCGSSMLG